MGSPVSVDPVPQRAIMDTKISSHLRDRLTRLDDHLHRLSLELRAEPATLLGHEHILSVERHCPRSLVHPTPRRDRPRRHTPQTAHPTAAGHHPRLPPLRPTRRDRDSPRHTTRRPSRHAQYHSITTRQPSTVSPPRWGTSPSTSGELRRASSRCSCSQRTYSSTSTRRAASGSRSRSAHQDRNTRRSEAVWVLCVITAPQPRDL